jgi:hypothetical protein
VGDREATSDLGRSSEMVTADIGFVKGEALSCFPGLVVDAVGEDAGID